MKLKYLIISLFLIVGVLLYVNSKQVANSPFLINQNKEGIGLSENGIPILFYQKKKIIDVHHCVSVNDTIHY